MTVIFTLPAIFGSTTAPKMMLASSCAASWMIAEASLTSTSDRSGPPVTLMMTPRAPLTEASSSSGLEIARLAASMRAVFAFGEAGAHDGEAHAGHDRLDVGEVEVDQPRHQDQVGNALNRLPQHVVGAREGFVERRGAGDRGEEALVGNRDDRVDALAQLVEAALGLQLALAPLEAERLGDDGDGQRAELAGQAGDDRRGAGAGAAAEAGGHEDHVRAVERFDQLVGVLEGRLPADVRIGAGAEALGQLRADLQLVRARR